jgi:hypothetical protein
MAVLRALIFVSVAALLSAPLFAATDANSFDEGLFEDGLPQAKTPKAKPGEWMTSLAADITVNYTFNDAARDSFKITYHISLGGPMVATTSMLRGNATIKTDISGYLAKWGAGQCLLQVSVPNIPYEVTVVRQGEDKVKLGLIFKQKILEDWQSLCTFLDAPDSRFYTKGEPEKWIGDALQKSEPDLNKLEMSISEKEKTETKFKISKYSVKDGSIGTAEVEGAGTVTIQPPIQLEEKK